MKPISGPDNVSMKKEWVKTVWREPTFWEVYWYCTNRNWAIVPLDSIDDEVPKLSISIDWLMKHSEYGVIERWLKVQEKENENNR